MLSLNNKGFTLIELMVVILIIAILSTVILISLNSARKDARDSQRIADMQMVLGAQNLYYSHNNYFFTDNGVDGIPDINGYLTAPSGPGIGVYVWENNTGCDPSGEYFCVYATLETSNKDCDYLTYIAVSEKGIETICETFQETGFIGTGCSCW
jgi:prepilin-type N-terminal cleavage/methylation domain-containing protein